jgi:L-cysteate sulfo-lyase
MLNSFPPLRPSLGALPTPLHPLPNLSRMLGVEVWIKRDDMTGFAEGGNKVRKAAYLLADAQMQQCDVILTAGAIQSNHARVIAAASARCKLECHLVLSGILPTPPAGNTLLNTLSQAIMHDVSTGDGRVPTMEALAGRLRAEGRKPYIIPIGGSNAVGAQGYVAGFGEIHDQLKKYERLVGRNPAVLVFATSSGGTFAGLLAGRALKRSKVELLGIRVDRDPGAEATISQVANELAGSMQLDARFDPSEVTLSEEFVGEGYGLATPEGLEALRLLWRTEGILLDPVYTGKAMAALLALAQRGAFEGKRVVFLHTGGGPSVYARPEVIVQGFDGTL